MSDYPSTPPPPRYHKSHFSESSRPLTDDEGPFDHYTNSGSLQLSVSPVTRYETSPSVGNGTPSIYTGSSPTPLMDRPAYYRPESPDYSGQYPEVVVGNNEKEAYIAPKHEPDQQAWTHQSMSQDDHVRSRKRVCGMSKRLCWVLAVIVAVVVIGLGAGLGVGLTRSKKHNSGSRGSTGTDVNQFSIGGAINPAYYSTEGAFNGTGIAIASVNFGKDASIFVFYQKHNGDIDQLIYSASGDWSFVTTVATNARNATALSAVAYIVDSVATWHVFYFDEDRYLRQRISSNESEFQTNIWRDGPLNNLNLQGNDAEIVGMQACYWGNYYGSETNFNDGFSPSKTDPKVGMNLWYGSDNSTFQQYDWTHGQDQWNHSRSWPNMNTHAGVGCQSWLTNTTYYVMLVDQSNTLRIYWKDTDTNKTSTASHPIDTWSNTSVAITDLNPATAVGYTDFLAYQGSSGIFRGANISWAAENTTIALASSSGGGVDGSGLDEWAFEEQDAGLNATHMSITGLDGASGGRSEVILYQKVGNDIRLGRRDARQGDFTFNNVPVGQF